MHVEHLQIAGLARLTPRRLSDVRGAFCEAYSRRIFAEALGVDVEFVQDNQSLSMKRGTIRGLHLQLPPKAQAKLVRVVRGTLLDVAVDLRPGSPTYLAHAAVELSAANGAQLFIPAGFAHGFCTLEDNTEVLYKTDDYYSPEHDRAISWQDPDLAIAWPVGAAEAIVSDKDKSAPRLKDVEPPFAGWGN